MNDAELNAAIDRDVESSRGYNEEYVARDRGKNLDYYFRRPFGDEEPGRSKWVSSDVKDVVGALIPELVEVFASSDKAVEFAPRKPEDEAGAMQATEVVNYVFWAQNPGLLIAHDWAWDALVNKVGVIKYWWDKSYEVTEESYKGLQPEQLEALMMEDQDSEIIEQTVDKKTGLIDIKVRRKASKDQVRIAVVPPEEIRVSPRTRMADIDAAPFLMHRTRKTRSDLISEGYDKELVESLPSGNDDAERSEEFLARRLSLYARNYDERDEAAVWVEEVYGLYDFDDDGVDEKRKICRVGGTILSNDVVAEWPFASFCPGPLPHEFFGTCPADDVREDQLLNSVLMRQVLDNLYQANNPRWKVTDGVNLDDLLTVIPGGPVRMTNMDSADPMILPFVAQQTLPVMEFQESRKEQRTGVTRYNQGMDSNSLNKTATGINIITQQAAKKTRLMARLWAEIGWKKLFRGILKLLADHQQQPMVMRLTNNFVQVDPTAWRSQYDFTINVGLGTGAKDQMLGHLTAIAQSQAQVVQAGGMGLLVTPRNIYNVQAKIAQNAGFVDPDAFWTNPGDQMPQPQPDPKAQAEQAKQQAEIQKFQATAQLDQQKMGQEMAFKREELAMQAQIEREKLMANAELERYKAELDARMKMEARIAELSMQAVMQRTAASASEGNEARQGDAMQAQMSIAEQIREAVGAMTQALVMPKQIVSDENGMPIGIAPAQQVMQ